MKVLVTGATGFIGAAVVRRLLSDGDDVAILVRDPSKLTRLDKLAGQLTVLRADLADAQSVRLAISAIRPERCVHLAWYAEPGKYLHARENLACLAASLSLVEALIDAGCAHLCAAGTCAEYAIGPDPLREDGPPNPTTLYAAAKLSFALLASELARRAGMRFAWARIFYLYGPGEDQRRAIPALAAALRAGREFPATDGEQLRDYLHVDDVAAGFCALTRHGADGIYNISSGEGVRMRTLMELVGDLLGRRELIRFGQRPANDWDPPVVRGDNRKLLNLGWTPVHGLADGLALALEAWG